MELELLYRGERAGEGIIDMPDQAETLSRHPLALLWVFSIEQVPSIAFGFLVDRDGTVELSQPIILDLSRLGEQYSHFASGRPSVGGKLHIDLNTPNADGYFRGYLNGWGIEGLIHAELHGRDFHGYIHGDFDGVSRLRGNLRAEIDGQGIHGYVRMHGEFLGRGFGEFHLDISQSGLRVDAFGDGPFFRMRLRLDATEKESIVDQSFLWLLISIVRHELGRRATDSLNVSLHSLVLPIDSPILSTLLGVPVERLIDTSSAHFMNLTKAHSREMLSMRREGEWAAPIQYLPAAYTLVRYPTLQAPTRVYVGKPFVLTVGLGKLPDKGTSGLVVLENLPPDRESFPVEFEVLSNDFTFTGDNNRGILEVTPDERLVYVNLELTPLSIEREHHLQI